MRCEKNETVWHKHMTPRRGRYFYCRRTNEHAPLFGGKDKLYGPDVEAVNCCAAYEVIYREHVAPDNDVMAMQGVERERCIAMGGIYQARIKADLQPVTEAPSAQEFLATVAAPAVAMRALMAAQDHAAVHAGVVALAEPVALKAEPAKEHALCSVLPIWIADKGNDKPSGNHKRSLDSFCLFLKDPDGKRTDWRTVTRKQANEWRKTFKADGLSFNSARDRIAHMRAMFYAAIKEEGSIDPDDNPFKGVEPINIRQATDREQADYVLGKTITNGEVLKLWDAALAMKWGAKRHLHAMWAMRLAHFGFRPSEITSLRRLDVDRINGHVYVHVGEKTASSPRKVTLHPNIAEAFWAFVQANTSEPDDCVFGCFPIDQSKGEVVWFSQNFGALRKAAGLPETRVFKGFRSGYITRATGTKGADKDLAKFITAHGSKSVRSKHYTNFEDPTIMAEIVEVVAKIGDPAGSEPLAWPKG
jgi:integrase